MISLNVGHPLLLLRLSQSPPYQWPPGHFQGMEHTYLFYPMVHPIVGSRQSQCWARMNRSLCPLPLCLPQPQVHIPNCG